MKVRAGVITGVRVTHSDATVDEIAAASGDDHRTVVEDLRSKEGVREAFALQTCNRAEAYVVTDDPETGRAALAGFAPDVRDGAIVRSDHEPSLRHLMRVAAGLESLVLGEDQILGQLRTAYEDARGAGGIGPLLDDAVTKAIHVGERVRNETEINEGVLSLGRAAARIAGRTHDLETVTALVVGAGEMGTLAARSLADAGAEEVVVANRTVPHAEHVAAEIPTEASAVALPAVETLLSEADVVVTATGSDDQVVSAGAFERAGETIVVDLAQPHDVDPAAGDRADVTVYDLDSIESITEETREQRREAATAAERIVDEEFDHLLEQYKRKRADDVIAAMYEGAEHVKQREVQTAMAKLDGADEETREVIESMADALVGQLLSAPTKSLREAAAEDDWTTINTAIELFDPEFGEGGDAPAFGPDVAPDDLPDEVPDGVPPDVAARVFGEDD